MPLDGDVIRLGSGNANDIVLTDAGMPERGIELCREADERWFARRVDGGNEPAAAISAGMRILVGPVLIGFAEESEPWRNDAAPPIAPGRPPATRRTVAWLAGLAALFALGAAVALVVALGSAGAQSASPLVSGDPPGEPSVRGAASQPGVHKAQAIVYPARSDPAPPPFGVLSVRGGAHGFVVTDDGHVLLPGNARRQFTLERIEPRRIVFSGPHAAELPW